MGAPYKCRGSGESGFSVAGRTRISISCCLFNRIGGDRLYILALSALVAFQPTSTATSAHSIPASTQPFAIQDIRPAKERKTKRLSGMILNCNFNIFTIGDEGFGKRRVGANRLSRLQTYLTQRFGPTLSGHRLEVSKYWLAINGAAGGKEYSLGVAMGGGVLASTLADGVTRRPKCTREKMRAGWFDPAEITNNYTPLVVDFDAYFDGQQLVVHAVRSPKRDLSSGMFWIDYSAEDQADFDAVLNDAMRQIGDEIEARLQQAGR